MIRDARLTFSTSTSPLPLNTGAAGSYLIGDIVDLTNTGRDLGAGESIGDVYLYIAVAAAASSGGSATLQLSLVTSDDPALAGATVVPGGSTAPTPVATLAAGYVLLAVRLPSAVYKRYVGLQQTTGTAAFTGGSIYAFIGEDVRAHAYYPQAFS